MVEKLPKEMDDFDELEKGAEKTKAKILTDPKILCKLLVFVSRKIGTGWPDLYFSLPLDSERDRNLREEDVKEIKASMELYSNRKILTSDKTIKNTEKSPSSSGILTGRSSKTTVTSLDKSDIKEQQMALRCLKKWLTWHSKPNVEEIVNSLKLTEQNDTQLKLEKFIDKNTNKWISEYL